MKSFAGYFGFEYVSLPLLSAKYISASYAQPGLIAEGYANFGVVGAVINMLIPFAIAEGSLTYFLKKRNVLALCILSVPYTKLLFDGGTINNMILELQLVFWLCFSIFLHWIGVVLHGYGSGDIHFTKRKSVEDRTDEENI